MERLLTLSVVYLCEMQPSAIRAEACNSSWKELHTPTDRKFLEAPYFFTTQTHVKAFTTLNSSVR